MNLNSKSYLGVALIFLSLLPMSHGSQLLGAQNTYMQESSEREAIVTGHAVNTSSRTKVDNAKVFATVEFIDDDGIRRTANTNVSSYPPPAAIGDRVQVRVHHTRPEDVRLVSFSGLWLESAFYLVPGLLTFSLGLILLFKKQGTAKR